MKDNIKIPVIEDMNAIPKGDMPGDRIEINDGHIMKANVIFPKLLDKLEKIMEESANKKAVISVHGGSGVGKSETGAILSYYLNELGIGSYVMSGDNYPKRIPQYNDAERLRTFRTSGITGLLEADAYDKAVKEILIDLWMNELDADPSLVSDHPWLSIYQESGKKGLENYLGTKKEIDFDEINDIIRRFKSGDDKIMLKRMGRDVDDLWYDAVDFSEIKVLVIEWTHGNNANLEGVDVPILLNSTPEETLAHRRSRNRDGKIDSPFTTMVLAVEQEKLKNQAKNAAIIVTKDCELINYSKYLAMMGETSQGNGPMFNAYPDSIDATLDGALGLLSKPALKDCFESFYVLPSIYNTDLDRGFSVIDYEINETLASKDALDKLKNLNIDLKLDFILNHASVLSNQFQDILVNGKESKYADFFIDWNNFWDGCGKMNDEGVMIPDDEYIEDMFFRKAGLPILNVRMPDGEEVPYWNTFYQQVKYDRLDPQDIMQAPDTQFEEANRIAAIVNGSLEESVKPSDMDFGPYEGKKKAIIDLLESKRRYLGQMDLNIESPLVWEFYEDTLSKLASYGAKVVRLDAFAYAPKTPGQRNFLNEPDTWELLGKVNDLAEKYHLKLLPEIHAKYEDGIHNKIAQQGYMTYDFFLPGLLIDAIERQTSSVLKKWIDEILDQNIQTVNMLGCHDGIPLLDLKGLLSDDMIQNLIDTVVSRGGYVKDLHGKKNIYYQVNATYFSALGEIESRLLLARAVQMFMPGKPQIWYLDVFAGKNDHEAVKRAGAGGHKEINRTNLSLEDIDSRMDDAIVQEQLALIRLRNTHPAFGDGAKVSASTPDDSTLIICWQNGEHRLELTADFKNCTFKINNSL